MTTDVSHTRVRVILRKLVTVTDDLILQAERTIEMPAPPWAGLNLYNSEWRPDNCDESEDRVKQVAYDLKTGCFICYLPKDDFRSEASGSDNWTEEDVRQNYRDWALRRNPFNSSHSEPGNGKAE